MERRTSSYGPSWSDVTQWIKELEAEFGVNCNFVWDPDRDGKLSGRFRVRCVVESRVGGTAGTVVHTDWRAYPQKQYGSVPVVYHAMLVSAWAALDKRRVKRSPADQLGLSL